MDIQKERQEFELLPDIRGIIQDGFQFNSELNQYFHLDHVNHRLSYAFLMGAWQAWLAAKVQAVPEGFVLVPEECSDDMACKIAAIARVCGGIAGDIYEAVVNQAMIEAREQSHDGK